MIFWNDKKRAFVFDIATVLVILTAGAYLYLTNLSGAMPMETDENRAYHFTLYAPLIFIVCGFFTSLFRSFDAPYYVMGAIGCLNLLLVYTLVRRLFGRSTAFYAALVYLCYDFAVASAKFLTYQTMILFFILVYSNFFVSFYRTGKKSRLFIAGTALGLMFTTNASSYGAIASLMAITLIAGLRGAWQSKTRTWQALALVLAGAGTAYWGVELYIFVTFGHMNNSYFQYEPYWKHLFWYRIQPGSVGPSAFASLAEQIGIAFFRSKEGFFRNSFLALTVCYAFFEGIRRRDGRLLAFAGFAFFALAPMLLGGFFRYHVFHRKAIAFLAIPIAIGAAYGIEHLARLKFKPLRILFLSVFILYTGLSFVQCAHIKNSLSSNKVVFDYLKQNKIQPRQIVTLYPLFRYADAEARNIEANLPTKVNPNPGEGSKKGYYLIHWPLVYYLYTKQGVQYYLSSGILDDAKVGLRDTFLRGIKPLASWDIHPLNNPYLTDYPANYRLKLYALSDIFGNLINLIRLKKMLYQGAVF